MKSAGLKALKKTTANNARKNKPEAMTKERQEGLMEGILAGAGLGIKDIDVEYDGETAILYGTAESTREREKAVLILGNLEGVATVDDRMTIKNPEPEARFHEVKAGDTLSKIAREYYGDPMKYNVIFEANRPMLKDPNLIYPGQKLRIPIDN